MDDCCLLSELSVLEKSYVIAGNKENRRELKTWHKRALERISTGIPFILSSHYLTII